jgi:hypothetical protein
MFGLGPSPRARAKPHVLFDTRSVNGRLLVAPHALAMAAMYVEQDLGGKFFSHQMRGYGRVFADWVRLYTRMDIIVATYGSALVLGNMMPPGAASVMLSWPYAGGIDTSAALEWDYPADCRSGRIHWVSYHAGCEHRLMPNAHLADMDVNPESVVDAIRIAQCAKKPDAEAAEDIEIALSHPDPPPFHTVGGWNASLTSSLALASHEAKVVHRCWPGGPNPALHPSVLDLDGSYFRLLVRTFVLISTPYAILAGRNPSRLRWLGDHSQDQGTTNPSLVGTSILPPRYGGSILLVIPCGTFTWSHAEEVHVLRSLYGRTTNIGAFDLASFTVWLYYVPEDRRNHTFCSQHFPLGSLQASAATSMGPGRKLPIPLASDVPPPCPTRGVLGKPCFDLVLSYGGPDCQMGIPSEWRDVAKRVLYADLDERG